LAKNQQTLGQDSAKISIHESKVNAANPKGEDIAATGIFSVQKQHKPVRTDANTSSKTELGRNFAVRSGLDSPLLNTSNGAFESMKQGLMKDSGLMNPESGIMSGTQTGLVGMQVLGAQAASEGSAKKKNDGTSSKEALNLHLHQGRTADISDFSQPGKSIQGKDMQQVIDQIKDTLKHASSGTSHISFQVSEEGLGKVRFRIMKQEGKFKIRATAADHEKASVLTKHLALLKNSAKNEGIDITEIDVKDWARV